MSPCDCTIHSAAVAGIVGELTRLSQVRRAQADSHDKIGSNDAERAFHKLQARIDRYQADLADRAAALILRGGLDEKDEGKTVPA